jgi:LPXTG-motif cell wall-anchored protein
VVLSPDGKTAYVPNYWSQDVSVVDLTSQTVTATIPLAGSLFSIAISPDGTRLVVPNSIGTVFIIDTATNSVTQTVAVNDAPVYVAISPNSTTAYVTSANTPNLSVIDIASGVVTHTYGLNSGQVYGVTLTADGSKVFIAEFGGGSGTHVLQVDSASGTVDKTFEICAGPQIIKFSPDPNRLLVACNSGYLDVLNVETATVESTVTTQNGSRYVDVSSDGTKALVGNLDSHSLTVVSFNPALLPQVEPGRVVDKNAGSLAETGAASNPVILLIGLVFVAVALLGVKTSRR